MERPEKLKMNREIEILNSEIKYNRKHLDKIWENISEIRDRLQNLELHMNFDTRLLSIICSEQLNLKGGEIIKLVKRIKKEIEKDIQIKFLKDLFEKKGKKKRKNESA
jgi:hypothetical protein